MKETKKPLEALKLAEEEVLIEERAARKRAKRLELDCNSVAESYGALLAKYNADPRETEEKVKSLLFAIALYKWKSRRYLEAISEAADKAKKVYARAQGCRETAPNFIPQEERPAEGELYYSAI